ncbi:endonuclease domain-containing protein [Streptomyces sp. NPDC001981]|uniref:endonuclease domain-containing protein n=1 Tax=Streptomyces sp. NPDC001981 TaxID=3364628 RepID=UPI0036AB37E0
MPVTLTCTRCGKQFSAPPSVTGRKYCSSACFRAQQAENTAWMAHNCAHCGTAFRVRGKEERSYCSRACHLAATARRSRACAQCGADFYPKSPIRLEGTLQGTFCSKTCSGLAQRTRVTRCCLQCGADFEIKQSRIKNGRGSYCSKECQALAEGCKRTCQGCGNEFRATRSVIEQGWGTFCSQACTARRVTRDCRVCGAEFTVKQSVADEGRGAYCSNSCRHLGKQNRVRKTCPHCSVQYTVPASLKDKRRTCSRACWAKIMGADPGRAAILARARHDQLSTRTPTRPERILYALIDEVAAQLAPDLSWERQHRLLDRWTVDAAVPSLHLVLQADGDYWHGLLPKYHQDPRVLRNMANDKYQDRKLAEAGWYVLRFWESDLIHNLPACADRLRAGIAALLPAEEMPR